MRNIGAGVDKVVETAVESESFGGSIEKIKFRVKREESLSEARIEVILRGGKEYSGMFALSELRRLGTLLTGITEE
jgi:hypothetical protein